MNEEKTRAPSGRGREYVKHHRDGTIWARGELEGDLPVGYWEWFRKDGTRLRSGHFRGGIQVGEWTTYDQFGEVYKVTDMKDGKKDQVPMKIEPYPG